MSPRHSYADASSEPDAPTEGETEPTEGGPVEPEDYQEPSIKDEGPVTDDGTDTLDGPDAALPWAVATTASEIDSANMLLAMGDNVPAGVHATLAVASATADAAAALAGILAFLPSLVPPATVTTTTTAE